MASHEICHVELSSRNLAESQRFYEELFGWRTEAVTMGPGPAPDYALFSAPQGPGGGFNPLNEQTKAGDVLVYVRTPDIPASLAKVRQLGGEVVLPETEIPGVGWMALFKDPTGNVVGLFKGK